MRYEIPESHYVYEFSYPEEMPELASIVFYVGKATHLRRLRDHFNEAAGGCDCAKCKAIRSIWDAGLTVVRRIVFESTSEADTFNEERRRILEHRSPHLVNVVQTNSLYVGPSRKDQAKIQSKRMQSEEENMPPKGASLAQQRPQRKLVEISEKFIIEGENITSDEELEFSMFSSLLSWADRHFPYGFPHYWSRG